MEIEDEVLTPQQRRTLQGSILNVRYARMQTTNASLTPNIQAMISILEAKEKCYSDLLEGNLREAVQYAMTFAYSVRSAKVDIGKVEESLRELYRRSSEGMLLEEARNFVDMALG